MEGQRAVAEVILNRLHSDNFPDDLRDVIYGEGQFRTAWQLDDATPYQTQYEAIEQALYGPYILPETVVYFGWEKVNQNVWGWIGRHVFCHEFSTPADQATTQEEDAEEADEAEEAEDTEDPEALETVPEEEIPSGDTAPEQTDPEEAASEDADPGNTEEASSDESEE